MKLKVAAKAILYSEGKVLIVSDKGVWDFPGGGIEDEETLAQALVRELREELDLDHVAVPAKPVHVDEWFIRKPGHELHVVGVFYRIDLATQHQPTLSNEHTKFAWVSPEEIASYNVTGDTTRALEAAGL